MSTLIDDMKTLLALQAVDTQMDRAKAAIAALDTGAALAAAYNSGKVEFDRLRTDALKAEAAQKEEELHLQSIEGKAAQVEKTLYGGTVTGGRELENLQKELDMLGRQKATSEEKILIAMEAANNALGMAREKEAQLTAIAAKYKETRAKFKEQHQALSEEQKRHEDERAALLARLDGELLKKYESVRARRNGIGVALLLDSGACGACYTVISKELSVAIRLERTLEACEFCGRYLLPPTVSESYVPPPAPTPARRAPRKTSTS